MEKPIEHYWKARLADLKEALEGNNFEVFLANDAGEAKQLCWKKLFQKQKPKLFPGEVQ